MVFISHILQTLWKESGISFPMCRSMIAPLSVGTVSSCLNDAPTEPQWFIHVTFDGKREKTVEAVQIFYSDPVHFARKRFSEHLDSGRFGV